MHKVISSTEQDVAAQSLEQVLKEAMEEIYCLEEKNVQMQDALSELQAGILNLNNSVASFKCAESSMVEEKNVSRDETFSHHIQNYERISSALTKKLSLMITGNGFPNSELLQDAFQSGLREVKNKLSSLTMIIQQISKEKNQKVGETLSIDPPSACLRDSDVLESNDNLNRTSLLDSTIANLQNQLKDALEKNVKWQNYNMEREQYVSLLLSKYNSNCNELQQLREKLTAITSQPDKLAIEQRRHFDSLLVNARQELENQRNINMKTVTELDLLKEKYKEEMNRLESNVEHWRTRYEEQRESIAALNANYENEKRRSNNSAVESKEKQSQIQLLQRQVHMFSEDFRAERKEKEIAFGEIDFLKVKVNQLLQEIEKQKKKSSLQTGTDVKQVRTKNEYNSKTRKKMPAPSTPIVNKAKPPVTVPPNCDHLTNRITTRRPSPTPKPRLRSQEKNSAKPAKFSVRPTTNSCPKVQDIICDELDQKRASMQPVDNDSMLRCPNCDKQYSIDEHMLLLDHIDVCGD